VRAAPLLPIYYKLAMGSDGTQIGYCACRPLGCDAAIGWVCQSLG